MVDYTRMAATASRLINANGKPLTVRKKNRTPGDANKPWRGPIVADTVASAYGVVVPVNEDDDPQELVRRGTAKAYIAANDVTEYSLEGFDSLSDGTNTWKVIGVDVVNPGTKRIMYVLSLEE